MAPGYRNANTRRSGRGHIDHDVYEGLPVRQWRRDTVYVAPPPTQDGLDNVQDKWDVELPWGMPKDSHLLPQHAQDLLRAARSGRIYKRSLPVEEEVDDVDGIIGDKPEKKEDTNKDRGFAARAWKQVPRHMEGPDVDYLAKRRKGLQTPQQPTAISTAITMTRTTVKRTDAAGNVYQEVIVVPEGQPVDGEIVAQVPVVDPNTAATLNTAVAQPARIISRKPLLQKGKRKGPGRGRKKKILAPTSAPGPSPTQLPTTEAVVGEQVTGIQNRVEGLKTTLKTETSTNEDTEMGEDSQHASDDDGDDGEDGEEGEIIESDDEHDGSVDGHGEISTPTPVAEIKAPNSRAGKSIPGTAPAMKSLSSIHSSANEDRDATSSPDLSAAKVASFAVGKDEGGSGSPLKMVHVVKGEKSPGVDEALEVPVEIVPDFVPDEQQQQQQEASVEQDPEPVSEPLATTNETEVPVSSVSVSASAEEIPEIPTATAPLSSIEDATLPPPEPEPTQPEDELDEMLLDTIESSNLPPTESEGNNVEGSKEDEREREESEFPYLMGSLERHLDGNRSGAGS